MKNMLFFLSLLFCLICGDVVELDAKNFTVVVDGKNVSLYTLKNENGVTVQITNFGARIVSFWVRDKNGIFDDVLLGHNNIEQYIHPEGERFISCVVGRYANRIAKGHFTINGKTYQTPLNNNGQTLHGGLKGLDMVVWNVDLVSTDTIQLSYVSPDGSDGFPGTMRIKVVYTVTSNDEFKITYAAITDKPTVINLSNHAFFNLKGEGKGTINDHYLTINADGYTPVDAVLIPTGKITPVEGTPFDFRNATLIGERVEYDDEQLRLGGGYDHNWVLNRATEKGVELIASVYEPTTGRYLEVLTDQPGLQFYGGNFFNGDGRGKYNTRQKRREAIALETQHFPDSPNHPDFPSTILNPGSVYTQVCVYKFSTKNSL